MKKTVLLLVLFLLVGCSSEAPKEEITQIVRNVDVMTVRLNNHLNYETYIGHVEGSGIIKRSFEMGGKIDIISVRAGDVVLKDTPLITLNPEALQYALDAATAELNASKAQYSKALDASAYAKKLYNTTEQLFKEGITSQAELDQVLLNYKIAQDDVISARELRNQANTNVMSKEYMMQNSELLALKEGIVMDILVEVGELTAAGYPVIILRDTASQVNFGIAQDDLKYIGVHNKIDLWVGDQKIVGTISEINQIPDPTTQTYDVTVELQSEDLVMGQIVKVSLPTEIVRGSKIPLGAIRSDGDDYVFIVVDDQAQRVNIEVIEIFNQEVVVEGLPDHAVLIVEGIMNLVSGDSVKVVGE